MRTISNSNDMWKVKFQFLINRLGELIAQEGKKMVILNVEAHKNSKKQFKKYKETVEQVKGRVECVVCTSLPGEERIFWPYYDVQFYIRDYKDTISTTGNPVHIQRVLAIKNEDINTSLPDLDYWKDKNYLYKLDMTDYVDEQKLLSGEIKLNTPEIIQKFGHRQAEDFENKEWWYILKFFFLASDFQNLEGFGDLIGGIPNDLKIKCKCENLVDVDAFWKGIFQNPEQEFRHEYYLYIGQECESCGETICIYRPRGPLCPPLFVFMNFLFTDKTFKMTDVDILVMWQDIFKQGMIKDRDYLERIYSPEIIKFGTFFQNRLEEYNRTGR